MVANAMKVVGLTLQRVCTSILGVFLIIALLYAVR